MRVTSWRRSIVDDGADCGSTTAGTGSEVTSWATVWDSADGSKYSLANPKLYPEVAVLDPALTVRAPRGLTLATGLDALSHALESIWNVNGNPVSANFAVEAAREIIDTMPRLLERPDDMALRARQARASLLAGLAFSNTKTALAHNISYDITLKSGTIHGIACSFSLPVVMRWATGADPNCDAALRRIFGRDLRGRRPATDRVPARAWRQDRSVRLRRFRGRMVATREQGARGRARS